MESFLSYYYEFSKKFVFIPNVKKTKYVYPPNNHSKGTQVEVIDIEAYTRFVDECFEHFSKKNNKPIFVPISVHFSMEEIKQIVAHYIKKDRFYFWIDFESYPIDEVQTARVKTINGLFDKNGYFDKTLAVFTNIKREIISKRKADESPASDILGTSYGANIIGVDRDPQKPISKPPGPKPAKTDIVEHKSRQFDARTYYYVKNKTNIETKPQNVTNNSIRLSDEFQKQRQHFLEKLEIANYLSTKKMINSYSNGKILSDIKRTETVQIKLDLV